MRPAASVALALCALTGCFSDDPPQLSGAPASTTDDTTATATTASSVMPFEDPTTTTGTATTAEVSSTTDPMGPCPMGQAEKTWYVDGDGDGYGADDSAVLACDPPEGAIDGGGDCDDAVFEVNPGAAELCNELVDDDCDGLRDEYSLDNPECGMCVLQEFGGATYWSCQEPATWLDSEARCQEFGAHLVVPINSAELGFVRDLILMTVPMPMQLNFWSGIQRQQVQWNSCELLPDASEWTTFDAQPVPYLPWLAGEPNNETCAPDCQSMGLADPMCARENCVELSDPATGSYRDAFCGDFSFGMVCKAAL